MLYSDPFLRTIDAHLGAVVADAFAVARYLAGRLGLLVQDAEDASQDAAIAVMLCPFPFRTIEDASAYARAAAVKVLLLRRRVTVRRKVESFHDDAADLRYERAARTVDLAAREAATALAVLLDHPALNAVQRALIRSLQAEHDPAIAVRRTAVLCGCSVSTVRANARALQALARKSVLGLA